MYLELITKQVANLSRAIGAYIKAESKNIHNKRIEDKGVNDFVTEVDKNSEKKLVAELQKILPEAGIIAEEGTDYERKDNYNWIIDPLDGTTNFIHGSQPYSISIGLMEKSRIVSGVVYEINLNECFYAWQKGGAYLNGHKISTSQAPMVKDALVATGFPYSNFSRLDNYLDAFVYFMKNSHGLRRLGSAAVDLAYVACGRYDAFFEYGLKPWDVAGGSIIVQEAGGIVADFSGADNFVFGGELAAGNGLLADEFIRILSDKFNS
ncbi:MAG: inositol monophosphatase family protein [Bacteroidales bacterium]